MHAEGPYPWEFRSGFPRAAHASVQPSHLRPEQGEGLQAHQTGIECAWGASRTQDCFYSKFSYIQTVVLRKNAMKVKVAIARKMLTAVWHVLNEGGPYRDYKEA